jgi:hypothetical protein
VDAALIGGQAVNYWNEPRLTTDIDFQVAATDAVRGVIADLLVSGFKTIRNQDPGEGSGPDFAQLKHLATGINVDFLVAKTEFEAGLLARARRDPGAQVAVATPEDLIVTKLIANRRKDQIDAAALGKRPGIDWEYVERWAEVWEVADRCRGLRESLANES